MPVPLPGEPPAPGSGRARCRVWASQRWTWIRRMTVECPSPSPQGQQGAGSTLSSDSGWQPSEQFDWCSRPRRSETWTPRQPRGMRKSARKLPASLLKGPVRVTGPAAGEEEEASGLRAGGSDCPRICWRAVGWPEEWWCLAALWCWSRTRRTWECCWKLHADPAASGRRCWDPVGPGRETRMPRERGAETGWQTGIPEKSLRSLPACPRTWRRGKTGAAFSGFWEYWLILLAAVGRDQSGTGLLVSTALWVSCILFFAGWYCDENIFAAAALSEKKFFTRWVCLARSFFSQRTGKISSTYPLLDGGTQLCFCTDYDWPNVRLLFFFFVGVDMGSFKSWGGGIEVVDGCMSVWSSRLTLLVALVFCGLLCIE